MLKLLLTGLLILPQKLLLLLKPLLSLVNLLVQVTCGVISKLTVKPHLLKEKNLDSYKMLMLMLVKVKLMLVKVMLMLVKVMPTLVKVMPKLVMTLKLKLKKLLLTLGMSMLPILMLIGITLLTGKSKEVLPKVILMKLLLYSMPVLLQLILMYGLVKLLHLVQLELTLYTNPHGLMVPL